jgi:ligand-binding SRPBCC domain-containing protein
MKSYRLETQVWLNRPREDVFKFFADPQNLERLTPSWLHFKILTPPGTEIRRGALLDYRLRIRGIPLRWQSEIAVWEPPLRFVDRQTRGPYSLWVHEHTFAEKQQGTLVGDRVEYAVRGGRLVQKFLVGPDLERIFRFRQRVLQQIFEAPRQSVAP